MADIFDVIADATRRDILQILLDRYESDSTISHGGTSVSDIVTALGLPADGVEASEGSA